jgi:hypothetical protein
MGPFLHERVVTLVVQPAPGRCRGGAIMRQHAGYCQPVTAEARSAATPERLVAQRYTGMPTCKNTTYRTSRPDEGTTFPCCCFHPRRMDKRRSTRTEKPPSLLAPVRASAGSLRLGTAGQPLGAQHELRLSLPSRAATRTFPFADASLRRGSSDRPSALAQAFAVSMDAYFATPSLLLAA